MVLEYKKEKKESERNLCVCVCVCVVCCPPEGLSRDGAKRFRKDLVWFGKPEVLQFLERNPGLCSQHGAGSRGPGSLSATVTVTPAGAEMAEAG